MKKEPISMPVVKPIPFDSDCSYFKRIVRWFLYTREWEFEEDWYFSLQNNDIIMIPRGFRLDGASVPKLFRFLLSPTGILFIPGIVHDFGYRFDKLIGVTIDENGKESLYNYHRGDGKAFWDCLFRQIGRQRTRLYIIPDVAYWAVTLFGFSAWRRCREEKSKASIKSVGGVE